MHSNEMTLEQAQVAKLERICEKLQLGPRDRVIEIGSGWGAFALYAARSRGCHVTTTTITLEGLSVRQGILTADRIVARMHATHFMNGPEAKITFEGSEIDNLRIGNQTVSITYDDPMR